MNQQKIWKKAKAAFDSSKTLLFAVFVALIFRYSVAAPYKIPTGSMVPTLKINDFIFVSKLAYAIKLPFTNYNLIEYDKPKRGDVIVFIFPVEPEKDFIKRIVAIEGDTVELKEGILYINGKPMKRVPVADKSILSDLEPSAIREAARLYSEQLDDVRHLVMDISPAPQPFGPRTVPSGAVFVMGDNRDNSADSRFWGYLPLENVRGRALFVWLSYDKDHPYFSLGDFFRIPRIRWERFGMKVR